jgi:hypothetical protein
MGMFRKRATRPGSRCEARARRDCTMMNGYEDFDHCYSFVPPFIITSFLSSSLTSL